MGVSEERGGAWLSREAGADEAFGRVRGTRRVETEVGGFAICASRVATARDRQPRRRGDAPMPNAVKNARNPEHITIHP